MHLKLSFGKWQPFCFGLNVLNWLPVLWQWWSIWKLKEQKKSNSVAPPLGCMQLAFMQQYWAVINSLAPGKPGCHLKNAIFNLVLSIGIFTSSNDNPLRWMPWDFIDDKSTLVQVMAWCRQATSHYLSQCWPSSMSPYGVTRPQFNDAVMRCKCIDKTWPDSL